MKQGEQSPISPAEVTKDNTSLRSRDIVLASIVRTVYYFKLNQNVMNWLVKRSRPHCQRFLGITTLLQVGLQLAVKEGLWYIAMEKYSFCRGRSESRAARAWGHDKARSRETREAGL
ncbi:hypothetical protein NL676_036741 [Syzygium grande]|nr:hypothetical protein NL676_036741 [Syzygium grande]